MQVKETLGLGFFPNWDAFMRNLKSNWVSGLLSPGKQTSICVLY